MRKRNVFIGIVVVILVLVGYFAVRGNKGVDAAEIIVNAEVGQFVVDVEITGELEAKNSTKILGPGKLRDFRIFNVAINDIVDEGTVVKQGQWVATLDNSELLGKLQDAQLEVDRMQSQFTQTQLDTALQMRQARDELINLDYAVQEREIELEQSKFEPPATQRQSEMNLEKAQRGLQQAKENYVIKKEQNKAKMAEVAANLRKEVRDLQAMEQLISKFTILAPKDGMVIYRKGFDGRPMKEGSTISAWDPTVAELPDLAIMLSKTYVNEVDVRKVKPGQQVEIGLDAFPEKRLAGTVIRVANVGEQRPNSDAKVFQVSIEVHGRDDLLRPGMTTSNKVVTQVVENALYIPLECLHTQDDSITFVYKRDGINTLKQEVMVGQTNANAAIIESGLEPNDRVYLSVPSGLEERQIALLPEMDGKRNEPAPEPQIVELPSERTITLPDGRTVSASQRGANGGQRPNRTGQSPQTGTDTEKPAVVTPEKKVDQDSKPGNQ